MKRPDISVSTDAVVFTKHREKVNVLLVKRKKEPFKNCWALPGGFLEEQETLETGVKREVEEETGLLVSSLHQIRAFGAPDRDPRGRTITIAFWGEVADNETAQGQDDALEAQWFDLEEIPSLAFDHDQILAAAVERFDAKNSTLQ